MNKELIDKEMTDKYGSDWLDNCIKGLEDQYVRESLKEILEL